jgi:hypothetical protein
MDVDTAMMIVSRDWELPRINDAAGIDARWLHSFLALRMADLLAQVAIGDRLHQLPPDDRAWFKAQCENLVTDAVNRYDVMLIEHAERAGDTGPVTALPEAS